jgi:hypothetical protein
MSDGRRAFPSFEVWTVHASVVLNGHATGLRSCDRDFDAPPSFSRVEPESLLA